MSRGYAAIGLYAPKRESNVGGVLRAAYCYKAQLIAIQGMRYKKQATDTTKAYNTIPLIETNDLHSIIPYNCVPVCIEFIQDSMDLIKYTHPERAFYIFGPEDGNVPNHIRSFCRDIVYVPTQYCMNLAATVNVLLYDRLAKQNIKLL